MLLASLACVASFVKGDEYVVARRRARRATCGTWPRIQWLRKVASVDSQTFFTLLLSLAFALGVAVTPYAMSPQLLSQDWRAAGRLVAWGSVILLCVWYGGTNDMQRGWRYVIAGSICGCNDRRRLRRL